MASFTPGADSSGAEAGRRSRGRIPEGPGAAACLLKRPGSTWGQFYESRKQTEKAVETYPPVHGTCIPCASESASGWRRCSIRLQRFDEAEQVHAGSLKIDPDNRDVRLTLALFYMEKKDNPRAR